MQVSKAMGKENISRALMLLSFAIALCQLALLGTFIASLFSSLSLSDSWGLAYFLGEVSCVILGIPCAVASLALSTEGKRERWALVLSIGVAAIGGFFMIFPA